MAQEILGTYLYHRLPDLTILSGKIVEVEAYLGPEDRASHARFVRKKRDQLIPTKRSSLLFGPAGIAYVYMIYGMHYCMNVVAHSKGEVGAILIRSIIPSDPIIHKNCRGPGRLCAAFQIDLHANGIDITSADSCLWIETQESITKKNIIATPRIGIDYAQNDALLPYRFILP